MAKEETVNPLDAILNQYEKNTENKGGNKPKISNEERLKKYFNLMPLLHPIQLEY